MPDSVDILWIGALMHKDAVHGMERIRREMPRPGIRCGIDLLLE